MFWQKRMFFQRKRKRVFRLSIQEKVFTTSQWQNINRKVYINKCIGCSMNKEKIIKRITTKEVTEYLARCSRCGRRIIGSTKDQVAFNLVLHQQGKSCRKESEE